MSEFARALEIRRAQRFENLETNVFPGYMTTAIFNDGLAHQFVHTFRGDVETRAEAERIYRLVDQTYRKKFDSQQESPPRTKSRIPLLRFLSAWLNPPSSSVLQGDYRESFRIEDETVHSISTLDVKCNHVISVEYVPEIPGRVIIRAPKLRIEQIQQVLQAT